MSTYLVFLEMTLFTYLTERTVAHGGAIVGRLWVDASLLAASPADTTEAASRLCSPSKGCRRYPRINANEFNCNEHTSAG